MKYSETLRATLICVLMLLSSISLYCEDGNSYPPGLYPQASKRILTESDFSGMSAFDMKVMRNEIFARHGYIFSTQAMKEYFADQSWYNGVSKDVSAELSEIELKNVSIIKGMEAKYPDGMPITKEILSSNDTPEVADTEDETAKTQKISEVSSETPRNTTLLIIIGAGVLLLIIVCLLARPKKQQKLIVKDNTGQISSIVIEADDEPKMVKSSAAIARLERIKKERTEGTSN